MLEQRRLRLRGAFLAVRRARHEAVRAGGGDAAAGQEASGAQFFSFQWSASRCLNELTSVARLVLVSSDPRWRRGGDARRGGVVAAARRALAGL